MAANFENSSEIEFISKTTLARFVEQKISHYFSHLEGQPAQGLHELVIKEAEKGLFRIVLEMTNGNQSKAANMLGLARGTFRKKLHDMGLD